MMLLNNSITTKSGCIKTKGFLNHAEEIEPNLTIICLIDIGDGERSYLKNALHVWIVVLP